MPIPLDDFTGPGGQPAYIRDPDDFLRLGIDGPPRVMCTKNPTGLKAELQAQCVAAGLDDSGTVKELKERLGPQPTFETYGRPSGFGNLIDDTYNLQKWGERVVALGIAMEPSVLERLQGTDPADEKSTLDGIVARAREVADADLASARGTFVHTLTEAAEAGDWSNLTPDLRFGLTDVMVSAIAKGWLQLLDDNGLEVVASEFKCVNDDLRLAGSGDRICRTTSAVWFTGPDDTDRLSIESGEHVVVDIKTSKLRRDTKGLPDYWDSYPMQIEAYRGAAPYDVATETRGEWPFTLNSDVALIAHFDVDRLLNEAEAVWQLIAVDLEVARQGIAAVQAAKAYHSANKFAMPTTVTTVPASPSAAPSTGPSMPVDVEQPAPPEDNAPPVGHTRDELAARFHALGDIDQSRCREAVAAGLAAGDLDAVAAAIDAADPFTDTADLVAREKPTPEPLPTLKVAALEGSDVNQGRLDDLAAQYRDLDAPNSAWVNAVLADTVKAGASIHLSSPSARRYHVVFGLVAFAREYYPNSDREAHNLLRAVLAIHIGDIAHDTTYTIGRLVASLDVGEAVMFEVSVDQLIHGQLTLSYAPGGRATLTRTAA